MEAAIQKGLRDFFLEFAILTPDFNLELNLVWFTFIKDSLHQLWCMVPAFEGKLTQYNGTCQGVGYIRKLVNSEHFSKLGKHKDPSDFDEGWIVTARHQGFIFALGHPVMQPVYYIWNKGTGWNTMDLMPSFLIYFAHF